MFELQLPVAEGELVVIDGEPRAPELDDRGRMIVGIASWFPSHAKALESPGFHVEVTFPDQRSASRIFKPGSCVRRGDDIEWERELLFLSADDGMLLVGGSKCFSDGLMVITVP